MYLILKEHAVMQMRVRGISLEQIEETLRNPDTIGKAKLKGAKRIEKKISSRRRLAVIIVVERRFIRIITAFWV